MDSLRVLFFLCVFIYLYLLDTSGSPYLLTTAPSPADLQSPLTAYIAVAGLEKNASGRWHI